MKNMLFGILITCMFCLVGCSASNEEQEMDGFENASINYDKFNSYASENGLEGTHIYVEGTVLNQTLSEGSDIPILGIEVENDNGNKWLVSIVYDKKIDEISGKNIRAFGIYQGFSDVMKMPGMIVATEDEEKIDFARLEVEKDNGEYEVIWNFYDYVNTSIIETEEKTEENEEYELIDEFEWKYDEHNNLSVHISNSLNTDEISIMASGDYKNENLWLMQMDFVNLVSPLLGKGIDFSFITSINDVVYACLIKDDKVLVNTIPEELYEIPQNSDFDIKGSMQAIEDLYAKYGIVEK